MGIALGTDHLNPRRARMIPQNAAREPQFRAPAALSRRVGGFGAWL